MVLIQDLAAPREQYDQFEEALGVRGNPPQGLIVHTACETASGMRIVDVWESREAWQRFRDETLGPTVQRVAEQSGQQPLPPVFEELDVYDLLRGES